MNKLYSIFIFLASLLFLASCEDDHNTIQGAVKTVAAELNSLPDAQINLQKPKAEENPFLFRLTWNKARFNYENGSYANVEEVKYTVEMDLMDHQFSNPVILAETDQLYTDLYTIQLKEMVDQINMEENTDRKEYHLRVKTSTIHGEEYSEPMVVSISSYLNVDPVVEHIYMIGDMNGWDNSNKDYIMFRNSNDVNDGVYTYTGYFPQSTYFKFCAEKFLGSYDNMYSVDNGKLKIGDFGAFYVEQGYYKIEINTLTNDWSIESITPETVASYSTLGPIGGFVDWDNEPPMTKSNFDPHQWRLTYTFSGATACKFRADKDWSKNWGGKDQDIPYGTAYFDGPGATIPEAGTYDIYFNDLTGSYVIKKH